MKKILLFTFVLLALGACKTPAKLVNTGRATVNDRTQVYVEEQREIREQTVTATTVETGEQVNVVEETATVVYDTEKPADPVTGKPPVKSEKNSRKTTTSDKQKREQAQLANIITDSSSAIDNTKKDVETNTKTTHKETSKTPKIAYVFYIMLLLGVIAAGWFLNSKFKWLNKLLG
jgi:cobalamin biosynthesis Mg chelatase CobN